MASSHSKNGFTIIEVVLVLAVAGLIFLIVFVALPQLQMARRNHVRKGHASQLLGAVESYIANNSGILPSSGEAVYHRERGEDTMAIVSGYLGQEIVDPSTGLPYEITYGPSISGFGYMDWLSGASCAELAATFDESSNTGRPSPDWRNESEIAVVVGLEPGDTYPDGWLVTDYREPEFSYYCIDNS